MNGIFDFCKITNNNNNNNNNTNNSINNNNSSISNNNNNVRSQLMKLFSKCCYHSRRYGSAKFPTSSFKSELSRLGSTLHYTALHYTILHSTSCYTTPYYAALSHLTPPHHTTPHYSTTLSYIIVYYYMLCYLIDIPKTSLKILKRFFIAYPQVLRCYY